METMATQWLQKILLRQADQPFTFDEWQIALEYAMILESRQLVKFAEFVKTAGQNTYDYETLLHNFKTQKDGI